MLSMPLSFLSLALASSRLFYSQRLGVFTDPDPSLKMTFYALTPNAFLIAGPLFTLILSASYLRLGVLVIIVVVIILNYTTLKLKYFTERHREELVEKFYDNRKFLGTKEARHIFIYQFIHPGFRHAQFGPTIK